MSTQYGRNWLRNLLEIETKTRPLNIAVQHHSDSYAFSIVPIAVPVPAFGRLAALRVQDLYTFEWFEWAYGVWTTRRPEVHVGPGKLYIAAWAVNEGKQGLMQLIIKDDVGNFLAVKQHDVPAGQGIGDETGTIDMPDRQYGILVLVEP
ncbi:hypothetical protein ES703_79403 [subsurface metagenome]